MASYTPNINLKKPTTSEMYNVLDWNDNSDKIDTAIGNLNSQFGVYTAPSGSSLKQLAFTDSVCPVNSVKWINLRNCSTSDLPNANAVYGLARVTRRVATVARVEIFLDNGITYIATATDSGSTWTAWENPFGSTRNQIVLPDSAMSYVITGVGNWQYCSLLFIGLVNGKGATLMSINTTGSTVEKNHLGGVDCTNVLNASFSGTSLTLSVSSSSNSFRGLVIASQGITSAT